MWHCMVWWVGSNSTEKPAAFIYSVVAREGVKAAVTYWGLCNRLGYTTVHCSSDIMGPVRQIMLHYTAAVT